VSLTVRQQVNEEINEENERISHPFTANVLSHLPAGDGPDHGADIGQRTEHRELRGTVNYFRQEET